MEMVQCVRWIIKVNIKHSENNHHERAAYMFGCVRQLLFDSFHNLPEGGSV